MNMQAVTKEVQISCKGYEITRTDERGNVTVWRVLGEFKKDPKSATGIELFTATTFCTFNGGNGRKIKARFDKATVLAFYMSL